MYIVLRLVCENSSWIALKIFYEIFNIVYMQQRHFQ